MMYKKFLFQLIQNKNIKYSLCFQAELEENKAKAPPYTVASHVHHYKTALQMWFLFAKATSPSLIPCKSSGITVILALNTSILLQFSISSKAKDVSKPPKPSSTPSPMAPMLPREEIASRISAVNSCRLRLV